MSTASPLRSTIDVPALLDALPARISDIPALAAGRDPQHVALIEDGRRLTNAQLVQVGTKTISEIFGFLKTISKFFDLIHRLR